MASEENDLFDVEAQQLPLLPTHEPESTSRRTWRMAILFIRSANLFKSLGKNYSTDGSSSDSSVSISLPAYTSVGTADGEDNAGSEIVEAAHVSLEFPEDSLIVNSTPQSEYTSTIELQRIQMGNITEMVKTMNLDELHNIGGVQGVADALNTNLINGLSDNLEAFSECNTNEISQALTFFHFFKEGCNNYTIFLLSLAAVLSLSFGIKQEGVANGWFDGTILLVSIFVLVVFIAIRSYSQARWYQKKFKKQWFSEGRNGKVKVIRSGDALVVPSSGLRVGDLICLLNGYQVPADGIFADGQALQLDDGLSTLTVDSEHPFLFYGSRVINGDARMIATSVGTDTMLVPMMGKEIESPEKKCEFEVLLHKLRTRVDFSALLLSILILIVMFLRYSLGKRDDEFGHRPDPKGEPTRLKTIMDVIKGIIIESKGTARVLIASLSVSVVGIMEGIPFVISFAVARRSRKTLAENASENDPLACVKMASVTAICTDKYSGLTVDKFFVDKGFVGESSEVSPNVLESLCDGIGISLLSSSHRVNDLKELVLISWAEDKFGLRRETLRHQCSVVKHTEDNLFRCSGALLLKTTENGQERHLHYNGPPQDILSMCSGYYNVAGEIHAINGEKRRTFEQVLRDYMLDGREVIAYAWKRTDGSNVMSIEANDLIFVGMVGLSNINPVCIRNAVSTLKEGGVRTILVSGDCIDVLRTIGNNYGLLTPESDALTGEEFRNLTDGERRQKLDRICIMGSCTLHDKVLLVKCLREEGEVVAMLGQKTNDAPALKEADIGLTMGIWSSEIARECSDIDIRNGNFTFLVNLMENGRCIYENIREFIQFQLIFTISSSLINFIATIGWGDAPMTAFEFFWLNMVVAIPGGLALLSECPKESLMKMPLKSAGQLITKAMWRNIALQASYQTAICLTLHLKGRAILGIGAGPIKSMIYNSLFLCQLFNLFVARELEKKNIFKGLHQNRWFWVACAIFLTCQAAMVAAENVFDISTRLNWMLWASCILIGLISWPLDFAGKWIGSLVFLS
ncbi:calcium-transporting ATPase 12, plasma membrane-type-like [Olea europaea var. sylvestris]|nr:calcium-transporting ATPase 12, plasma membrane-type-like [Olea europaea var. sylvestris]XP_022880325.1 calcium-transporting ATPase 12, plasma membrane-type-like [Olea europaea var. sylvestris]